MSYQVLARKWRPHTFREIVGQTHVLRALINALDRDQLHHAYLFTGTRGVGKTTIARILAKCLNCETGVSSEPCGSCGACNEIAEGRFVDLIEVDGASRTKVEDTRELLDNVQYAPVSGRFKVYIIDEVHMLSTHSFNALLKTLEEPPPHVKFLLATTDPQKLPATVLSRCLQFHLKNMSPENIVKHLEYVLEQEMVSFEAPALGHIAYAAEGSMRDALSLTDQAIAFGAGEVKDEEVRDMLGSIDRASVWKLLESLRDNNAEELLAKVQHMADHSADFAAVLDELLHCLHLIMRQQLVPNSDVVIEHKDKLDALSEAMLPEQVQLYYQIALNGRKDIAYAPTARQGAEVALLRMLAFKPMTIASAEVSPAKKRERVATANPSTSPAAQLSQQMDREEVSPAPPSREEPPLQEAPQQQDVSPYHDMPLQREAPPPIEPQRHTMTHADVEQGSSAEAVPEPVLQGAAEPSVESKVAPVLAGDSQQQWLDVFPQLAVRGVIKSMASQCEVISNDNKHWDLLLNEHHSAMYKPEQAQMLAEALSTLLGDPQKVTISLGNTSECTPAEQAKQLADSQHVIAMDVLQQDSFVQVLLDQYNGKIDTDSVSYLEQ